MTLFTGVADGVAVVCTLLVVVHAAKLRARISTSKIEQFFFILSLLLIGPSSIKIKLSIFYPIPVYFTSYWPSGAETRIPKHERLMLA